MSKKQYTIIKSSSTLDVYNEYDLIESPAIVSLKNVENKGLICVGSWVEYRTVDNSGNEITCISVQDANTGEVFSGQSATFRESFSDVVDRISDMEETPDMFFIEVLHKTSKSGRDYLICALVSPDRALARMGYSEKNIPMPEPQK
jgi:hypothetical protein|nr:MAG TPA: hypothetical protein [Caudoviricetes sp.]